MKNTPKISIILPVYNRRHLIDRAIRSVLDQIYRNWELLIIDDGSTDDLQHHIIPLLTTDSRFRYMCQDRMGPAETRNRGLKNVSGDYVTFLDSDDEYRKNHLQLRVEYMLDHPNVDVMHGGVELVGPRSKHWVVDARHPEKKIHLDECYMAATLFGKRCVFLQSGGFKPLSYSAESEFIPRLLKTYCVVRVDFPTYRYYTGLSDSICAKKINDMNYERGTES